MASAVLAVGVGMAVVVPGAAPSSAHGRSACAVTWGSLAKSRSPVGQGTVHGIRAGRHACFDRLVLVLEGRPRLGYEVRYVDRIHDDAGAPVPLRGGATIEVKLRPGYRFHPEDRARVDVSGFRTFRQVASGYSTGGAGATTPFGLGVRARLPFRVFLLDGGGGPPEDYSRLVVDVAHHW